MTASRNYRGSLARRMDSHGRVDAVAATTSSSSSFSAPSEYHVVRSESLQPLPSCPSLLRFATSFLLREFLLAAARAPRRVRTRRPSPFHHVFSVREQLPHKLGLGPPSPVLLVRPSPSFLSFKSSRLLALVRVAPWGMILVHVQNIMRRQGREPGRESSVLRIWEGIGLA